MSRSSFIEDAIIVAFCSPDMSKNKQTTRQRSVVDPQVARYATNGQNVEQPIQQPEQLEGEQPEQQQQPQDVPFDEINFDNK